VRSSAERPPGSRWRMGNQGARLLWTAKAFSAFCGRDTRGRKGISGRQESQFIGFSTDVEGGQGCGSIVVLPAGRFVAGARLGGLANYSQRSFPGWPWLAATCSYYSQLVSPFYTIDRGKDRVRTRVFWPSGKDVTVPELCGQPFLRENPCSLPGPETARNRGWAVFPRSPGRLSEIFS